MLVKRLTLTFDNGPTPGITNRVLDLLSALRIPATFFVIGNRVSRPGGKELVARAHAEGHWIGNHSTTHSIPFGENDDPEFARKEIEGAQQWIGAFSHPDKLFRPMGGGGVIGPHLLSRAAVELLESQKYTCVMWSSVPGDWKDPDGWVDRCVADIALREWTTVALHDIENAALPRLAEFLDRLGSMNVELRRDFPDDVVVIRRGNVVLPQASWMP